MNVERFKPVIKKIGRLVLPMITASSFVACNVGDQTVVEVQGIERKVEISANQPDTIGRAATFARQYFPELSTGNSAVRGIHGIRTLSGTQITIINYSDRDIDTGAVLDIYQTLEAIANDKGNSFQFSKFHTDPDQYLNFTPRGGERIMVIVPTDAPHVKDEIAQGFTYLFDNHKTNLSFVRISGEQFDTERAVATEACQEVIRFKSWSLTKTEKQSDGKVFGYFQSINDPKTDLTSQEIGCGTIGMEFVYKEFMRPYQKEKLLWKWPNSQGEFSIETPKGIYDLLPALSPVLR